MPLQEIIQAYGYPALFVGTFLEGETILVMAGFAAHRGLLDLRLVMLAAFLGSLAGDQLFFFLGRRRGRAFLASRPRLQARTCKVYHLLERYHVLLIFSFRFLYGLRTVTPFVLGTTGVRTLPFILLNTVGALVWTVAVALAGFFFGNLLEYFIADIKRMEHVLLAAIAGVGLVTWLVKRHMVRKEDEKATACALPDNGEGNDNGNGKDKDKDKDASGGRGE